MTSGPDTTAAQYSTNSPVTSDGSRPSMTNSVHESGASPGMPSGSRAVAPGTTWWSSHSASGQFGWRGTSAAPVAGFPRLASLDERLLGHLPAALLALRGVRQLADRHVRALFGVQVAGVLPLDLDRCPVRPLALPPHAGLALLEHLEVLELAARGPLRDLQQLVLVVDQRPGHGFPGRVHVGRLLRRRGRGPGRGGGWLAVDH